MSFKFVFLGMSSCLWMAMFLVRRTISVIFANAAYALLRLARWKRRTVEANLRHVDFFGNVAEQDFCRKKSVLYKRILKNLSRHVGEMLFCFDTYKHLPQDLAAYPWERRGGVFELAEGASSVIARMREGGIFLTAHYGNYEASGAWLCAMGVPLKASYIPLKPKWLNEIVEKKIRCVNDRPYSIHARSPREFLRLLDGVERGHGELFCLLADQDSRIESALNGTFLGKPVRNNPLPDFLLKHRPRTPVYICWIEEVFESKGSPSLNVGAWPTRRIFHAVELDERMKGENGGSILDLWYNRWLEQRIHENPALWYGFTHRRYFSRNKNIY